MELIGSRTEANLLTAAKGEALAHTKYMLYANKCRKEGYEQFGAIFDETARNEKEHCEVWLKYLRGGSLDGTLQNLYDAVKEETYEWEEMYVNFALVAREEGFEEIAAKMELVARIEKEHSMRYKKMIANLEQDLVFEDADETIWICRSCGNIHIGKTAPELCPVCGHKQGYFERKAQNY